jgi:hypothetical protein
MAAIERGQANTIDKINWFTTLNNVPTDFNSVQFQIWDISGGLPGDVIFPVPGDPLSWEDVSSGSGHFGVGSYYAYDNTLGDGWTPGLAEPIGTHRIKWRWKVTSGDAYRAGGEDFEVLSVGAGPGPDTYIEVQDVRDAGLTDIVTYPDALVLSHIEIWQAFLDRACRQWFLPREMILEIDGNDGDTLYFGVPIISVEYIKLNGSADYLDETLYKVYSTTTIPDARRNPRIALVGPDAYRDIFVAPLVHGPLKFTRGRQNQEIKGVFGFVESDGTPPKLIKRALLKLVLEKLQNPVYEENPTPSPPPILGAVLEEKTDDHSLKYAAPVTPEKRNFGLSGITSDPEILDIIKLYRAPIGVAVPAQWSYY